MIPFLPSPQTILAGLVSLLLTFGGGYWKGHRDADQSARVEALEEQAKRWEETTAVLVAAKNEALRQADAARSIAKRAADRERDALVLAETRQGQLDDYLRALADADAKGGNADRCALTDDDARRLRGIAEGAADRHPGGAPSSP